MTRKLKVKSGQIQAHRGLHLWFCHSSSVFFSPPLLSYFLPHLPPPHPPYNLFLHSPYSIKQPEILFGRDRELPINKRGEPGSSTAKMRTQVPAAITVICSRRGCLPGSRLLQRWQVHGRSRADSQSETTTVCLGLAEDGLGGRGGNHIWNVPKEELGSFGERPRECGPKNEETRRSSWLLVEAPLNVAQGT